MSFVPEDPMRPIYARRDQNTVQFEMPLVKKAQKPLCRVSRCLQSAKRGRSSKREKQSFLLTVPEDPKPPTYADADEDAVQFEMARV
jgi:hypothetical protein